MAQKRSSDTQPFHFDGEIEFMFNVARYRCEKTQSAGGATDVR